jgi:hypothetical protein
MAVEKVSVAIGREDLKWLRARAKREDASLSAVLTAAIRATREREAKLARQRAAIAQYVAWATDGKGLSPAVLEEARRELEAARSEAPPTAKQTAKGRGKAGGLMLEHARRGLGAVRPPPDTLKAKAARSRAERAERIARERAQ